MKKISNYILLFSIACTLISCTNRDRKNNEQKILGYNEIGKANWLIGAWQNNSPEGNATEVWEKKNDSAYSGRSYFIVGNDTVSSEMIVLEQNGNKLFYVPTVNNQNNAQPVRFILTFSTNNQLVFENPSHDFPQKISYTRVNNDSLLAEISGMVQGNYKAEKFPMVRQ